MLTRAILVHRARWHLAALTMQSALVRLRLTLKAYNPGQPRVPSGSSDGGQWTDADADGAPSSDDVRVIFVGGTDESRYSVVLEHEDAQGGPTLRDHLGQTDEEMLRRVQQSSWRTLMGHGGLRRDGSFPSREGANDFVNRTIEQNKPPVDQVADGIRESVFLTSRFGYKTGREAYGNNDGVSYMRDTYSVGVFLVHDPKSPKGYRVRTAYPRNDGDLYANFSRI